MGKIVLGFVGAPSSGKTTLARAVANKASEGGYCTEIIEEYARCYVQRFGAIQNPYEQTLIFYEQQRRQGDVLDHSGADVIVAECPTFVGYVYARILADTRDLRQRECLRFLEQSVTPDLAIYDAIFYLPPEWAYVMDGIRDHHREMRARIDTRLRGYLDLYGVPYLLCQGTLEQRVQLVLGELSRPLRDGPRPQILPGSSDKTSR